MLFADAFVYNASNPIATLAGVLFCEYPAFLPILTPLDPPLLYPALCPMFMA